MLSAYIVLPKIHQMCHNVVMFSRFVDCTDTILNETTVKLFGFTTFFILSVPDEGYHGTCRAH